MDFEEKVKSGRFCEWIWGLGVWVGGEDELNPLGDFGGYILGICSGNFERRWGMISGL